ncbi:hypothetical protein [Nostoc sp.]|uniref:hypothetical protein n=1 Tax=Nostoc sp. TaxID=1180 RepID=UPI002FFB9445
MHWCQLNVKASLEVAFRLPRSQSETGNAVLEAPPLLLAAEPPGAAFTSGGWKRGFKGVLA